MTETSARIVADSMWGSYHRVTTIECTFHRFVLAEMNTHRVFSRNSASSRAIPVTKMLQRFKEDPALPISWPAEQRGMQGGAELVGEDLEDAQLLWTRMMEVTDYLVSEYVKAHEPEHRLHKSLLNRWLEPAMWHTAIITSTEWQNFFTQRCTPLAMPEMHAAAEAIRDALRKSRPVRLFPGKWHLPYIEFPRDNDVHAAALPLVSAARCARVSYLTQNGLRDWEEDLNLYRRLVKDGHWSPLEHPCTPFLGKDFIWEDEEVDRGGRRIIYKHIPKTPPGNFDGYTQLRHHPERDKFLAVIDGGL